MSHFKQITVTALIAFGLATSTQVYAEPAASPPVAGISTPDAGSGLFLPPDLPPSVSEAGAQPLSVKGCDVAVARSRDDVVTVLLTAPSSPGNGKPGPDAPEFRPGAPVSPIDMI
ncbi:MAG: hypothetical protein ACR2OU_18205, partial [Thermomicrobiales bacterium]